VVGVVRCEGRARRRIEAKSDPGSGADREDDLSLLILPGQVASASRFASGQQTHDRPTGAET
jgi:hypothetical protein